MYFPKYGMMVPGRTEPGERLEGGQRLCSCPGSSALSSREPPGAVEGLGLSGCRNSGGSLGPQLFFSQMSDSGEPFKRHWSVSLLADTGMRV